MLLCLIFQKLNILNELSKVLNRNNPLSYKVTRVLWKFELHSLGIFPGHHFKPIPYTMLLTASELVRNATENTRKIISENLVVRMGVSYGHL